MPTKKQDEPEQPPSPEPVQGPGEVPQAVAEGGMGDDAARDGPYRARWHAGHVQGRAIQGPGEVTRAPAEGQIPPEPERLQEVPVHPPEPNVMGSSPHPNPLPVGAMGEDVRHETDDIGPDGTPVTSKGLVLPEPDIDGEGDRRYSQVEHATWQHGPAPQVGPTLEGSDELEPVVNVHSEEGARLDEIKLQRPVRYEPNAATLDPKSGQAKAGA